MTGIIYAILSAITWGAGDFCGGLASRRQSHYQVMLVISAIGLGLMIAAALVLGEAWPSPVDVLWSASAGLAGATGILALYYGLAHSNAAVVSPVAAVLSTALPLLASLLTEGLPQPLKLAGLVIAVPGIWLVTRSVDAENNSQRGGLGIAFLAGAGFAGFFILMAQIQEGQVFMPLVISKFTAVVLGVIILARRREAIPDVRDNPIVILGGVLDAGGNVFFLLAEQNTRLDIASVLSSMYAAVTVLLSQQILKERVTTGQWIGVVVCLLAIGLIVV